MRILALLLLFSGLVFASSDGSFRVAVFYPNAPALADPELQSMTARYASELQTASAKLTMVPVDSLQSGNMYGKAHECREFECALRIGRLNDLDLVVISRLQSKGTGHVFETSILSVVRGGTVASTSAKFGATLGEFEQIRPKLAESLMSTMQKSLAERGIEDQQAAGMMSGTHLDKTVLSGVLTADKSPYLVYGTIQVPAGEQLVIEPGVTLLFVPGQFAGLMVFGQLIAEGTQDKPIRFLSASKSPNPWDWNRILLAGPSRNSFRYVEIANSNFGIHVENSGLTLLNSHLHHNSLRGVFVRNSQVEIQDSKIDGGQIIGLQVSALADVHLKRTSIVDNRNGAVVMSQGLLETSFSEFRKNDRGLVVLDGASLLTEMNKVEHNQVGLASSEKLSSSLFEGIRDNVTNVQQVGKGVLDALVAEPQAQEIARVEATGKPNVQIGEQRDKETWNVYGNIQAGAGYSKVITKTNPGPLNTNLETDTIAPGQKYPNNFLVDGPSGKGMVYVTMESSQGRGIELQAEGIADRWITARAKPVTLRYWSPLHSITVGNLQESGSPLVLSNLPVLGAKYSINLGRNSTDQAMFVAEGFYGESKQPFNVGEKNLDLFPQYYAAGAAVAQQLTGYGRLTFNPNAQLRLQAGGITSEDKTQGLLLRKDLPLGVETRDPLSQSKAVFAAGQWKNRSGAFQVNADVAVGQADTADVFYQKALDEVFASAGLPSVSISQVRSLFLSDASVRAADSATVVAVFPSDSLTLAEARDSLIVLRHEALAAQKTISQNSQSNRTANFNWNRDNVAGRVELAWKLDQGNVKASLQSVGKNYFSPGAATLLQNSREYGIDWSQALKPFWDIDASYRLSIENAAGADDSASNIFGFGEGSRWGLWRDDAWHQSHLTEYGREKFVHTFGLDHHFQIGSTVDLAIGYHLEHSRQYLPTKLKTNFTPTDAVVLDPYFAKRTGSTTNVNLGYGDSVIVDSAAWAAYQALAGQDSIAWGFEDIRYKHTASSEIQYRKQLFTLKVGGIWAWQLDDGYFTENQLVRNFNFADTTWQKLGHRPNAQTWFEQSYPISLSAKLGSLTNKASFKPRWKDWDKDDLHEFEYRLTDRLEIPLLKRKLLLTFIGDADRKVTWQNGAYYTAVSTTDSTQVFHYFHTATDGSITPTSNPIATDSPVQGGEDFGDGYKVVRTTGNYEIHQLDISFETLIRINFSAHFYTELDGKVSDARRPQQLSEQHRDFMGGLTAFYSF